MFQNVRRDIAMATKRVTHTIRIQHVCPCHSKRPSSAATGSADGRSISSDHAPRQRSNATGHSSTGSRMIFGQGGPRTLARKTRQAIDADRAGLRYEPATQAAVCAGLPRANSMMLADTRRSHASARFGVGPRNISRNSIRARWRAGCEWRPPGSSSWRIPLPSRAVLFAPAPGARPTTPAARAPARTKPA